MEKVHFPVRPVSGSSKISLDIEGTILVYRENFLARKRELLVPIELIEIREGKRLHGKRLILSLLSLLGGIVLPMLIFTGYESLSNSSLEDSMLVSAICWMTAIGCALSAAVWFVRFWISVRTRSLWIAFPPEDGFDEPEELCLVEYWDCKSDKSRIDRFLDELEDRRKFVRENETYLMGDYLGSEYDRPFLMLLCWIVVFSMPAMVAEIPQLLYLVLLPIALFVFRHIRYSLHPKDYIQANREIHQKHWDDALRSLDRLMEERPDYEPAVFLRIHCLVSCQRFEDAFQAASMLSDDMIEEKQQVQLWVWQSKRIHQRRCSSTEGE